MATQNAINNQINGAAGAVVTSTTGALSVADGNTNGYFLTSTGTNSTPTFQVKPSATSKSLIFPTSFNNNQISSSASIFYSPLTQNTTNATESAVQQVMPIAATIKNLYLNCNSNSNTGVFTVTLRVNGASSSLVVTVPASTTGVFSDTTHTVSVNAGDLVNLELSQATTGSNRGAWSMVMEV